MSDEVRTLGDEYPKQQARVRALIGYYRDLGPVGTFGMMMLEQVLREADEAAISGDPVAMLRAFQAMKDCRVPPIVAERSPNDLSSPPD